MQEGPLDYCRWALEPICIVFDFKSLIAFLPQKLLGCEQHSGLDRSLVAKPSCFSEEGRGNV